MQNSSEHSPSFTSLIEPPTSYSLLQQQTTELIHTIQIKQTKIAHLESQLKNIKQEYANRLQLIENAYNQLKKQKNKLEKMYIEEKHLESLDWQQKFKKVNDQQRLSFLEKDKVFEKMINDQQETFEATLKNVQARYETIIKKIKEQSKSLQNVLLVKDNDQSFQDKQVGKQFTFGTAEYRYLSVSPNLSSLKDQSSHSTESNLMKEKSSLLKQVFSLKQKIQSVEKQLQTQKKINLQMQNDHRLHKMQLEQEILMMRKQTDSLNKKILNLVQERQTDKKVYTQKIFELERRNQRIHSHMKEIDSTYLLALTNRTRQEKPAPVTAIKSCNHAGLIDQFQRNIQIKDQEIQRLNQKVHNLEKMLGLDKNISQRLHQIGNISDRTLQIHKSQKDKIFNKTTKLAKW